MITSFKQQTLDIRIRREATFDNYCVGSNQVLYQHLLAYQPEQAVFNPVVLWGGKGVGRTHLLHALCHRLHAQNFPVAYLPFSQHQQFSPDILQGIEMMTAVCWDDVDAVAGLAEWEHALFHAYNRLQDRQCVLCISTTLPFKSLSFTLPDLASRLLSCVTFQVQPLNDADKIGVLQKRAQSHGFTLPDRAVNYLLSHYSRDMSILMTLLDTLDQASLAKGRCTLSIPFIKSVLA